MISLSLKTFLEISVDTQNLAIRHIFLGGRILVDLTPVYHINKSIKILEMSYVDMHAVTLNILSQGFP
jgi:hypothetical protein